MTDLEDAMPGRELPDFDNWREHALLFAADALERLRGELLADAPLESAAFVLARPVCTLSGAWTLLAYDVIAVAADEYTERSASHVQLPPTVVARVLQRARAEGASVVLVHSHPADTPRGPSLRDFEGERVLIPALARRVPDVPHARLIVGPSFVHAAAFVPPPSAAPLIATKDAARVERPLQVRQIGRRVRMHPAGASGARAADAVAPRPSDPHGGLDAADAFDRQVRAFGPEGQAQLAALRVAVIGVGGTGSVVVEQLAHLGVHDFVLIDPDVIEPTNLNRVVGATAADVGRPKVEVAAALIARIRPGARIECLRADIRDTVTSRYLLDTDFFFGCTDSQGSRAVMSQLAYQYLVPGIDMGVAIHAQGGEVTHVTGRVQMLAPGLACLLCSHVLDAEAVRRDLLTDEARAADPYIVGAAVPQPAVISINGAAASLAVTMFLSAVVGIPIAARHQRLRLETGVVTVVSTEPASTCPWCALEGGLARGDSWSAPGRQAVSAHALGGAGIQAAR